MKPFLRITNIALTLSLLSLTGLTLRAADAPKAHPNVPEMIEADGKLRLDFSEEQLVLPRGLQPSMLCTKSGAFVVQAQVPEKPFPSSRMTYPWAMETRVSRDGCHTWTKIPLKAGENGLNMEGGAIQLRDGTILALDTYITPGKNADKGLGQLYVSTNDWQTLDGPIEVNFALPNVDFYCSKDDGGHPHDAQRVHRRILELPNGDLLVSFYGFIKGDHTPSTYMPSMMKSRTMMARSADRGKHWKLVSTVAVGPEIGTEGFGEPVITRITRDPIPGGCFVSCAPEGNYASPFPMTRV